MSFQPERKRARLLLPPFEKKRIFHEIYKNVEVPSDDFFTKSSEELLAEDTPYFSYYCQLKVEESKLAKIESTIFINKFCGKVDEIVLISICNRLDSLLFDLLDKNLNDEKKEKIIEIITECTKNDQKTCKAILEILNLNQSQDRTALIPVDSKRIPYAPSAMTGSININAAQNNLNYVYPFPFNNITNHFPVFCCHPVFSNFMDILYNRVSKSIVGEYNGFINGDIGKKVEDCASSLIVAILTVEPGQEEFQFVEKVTAALQILFGPNAVKSNFGVGSRTEKSSSNIAMDAAVLIKHFPFIIIEAKNNSYSMNAVLQGLQYYGLTNMDFIDNDPSFLITLDTGIFYVYGVAKVNRRVVCSCLLSLEFTNYFFNIEGFNDKLFRCLGALRFFFDKFTARMVNKSSDSQHIKYSSIKSASSHNDQPFPAIFSMKKESTSQERIDIAVDWNAKESWLNPGVYRVKVDNNYALLKLACDYSIDVHKALAEEQLAPKILGHEILCDNYHLILMEYLDNAVYDSLFNFIHNSNDSENKINHQSLYNSLVHILSKLKELNIVHGDFRSNNILAKRSENNDSVLEDFKLVDFEFSGIVGQPYPFLAMRNPTIAWPEGFNSYQPRMFDHDEHMLNKIITLDFKENIQK